MNELDERIIFSINEDVILKELSETYDVYSLLEINEFHLKQQIEKNPFYQELFRMEMLKEKGKLMRLEIMRDEKTGIIYDELKNRSDTSYTKQEIERYYLPKDPELIKIKKLMLKTQIRYEFFEAVYDAFKVQGYNFKSYIETTR